VLADGVVEEDSCEEAKPHSCRYGHGGDCPRLLLQAAGQEHRGEGAKEGDGNNHHAPSQTRASSAQTDGHNNAGEDRDASGKRASTCGKDNNEPGRDAEPLRAYSHFFTLRRRHEYQDGNRDERSGTLREGHQR
jgi:hypothetical protein